jgi:hypothetical protein
MEDRFNEYSYDNISDIIGNRYKSQNIISSELGRKIMEELKISEETESVITGSYSDWCRFVLFIIEKYVENSIDEKPINKELKSELPDFGDYQKIIKEYEKSTEKSKCEK